MSRTPDEHAAAVRDLLGALPAETVGLADAARRRARLAAAVVAREDQPRFDNSQMDGYATSLLGERAAVAGPTVPAGSDPDALYPHGLGGAAAPVMTGAMLPAGTRAVVPVETCAPDSFVAEGEPVHLPAAGAGQFVRPAGSDIRAGDTLAPAGAEITPALFGALVAQGLEEVKVRRRARILLVTGGAEVSGTGAAAIRDTNGPMLEVLAHRHGIGVAGRVATDDDPAALRGALERAIGETRPDAVVTSGGISHGRFEVVRQVLADGWYGHVAQQPGGPQGLSHLGDVPVISLPGNPVSTLVSFRLYVAPFLGHAPDPLLAPLAAEITGLEGRDQFLRGRVGAGGSVEAVGKPGSHLLAQAGPATCLIRIPAGTTVPAGSLARVYPL
ncbi:molybdopterin molybdotransferase MoeA [Corynebacterium sp. UBA2622]|uniref:molybdopterin molybdotransferase MoeA n=1 Tax=Corynebacterium sp. UBA2622 TaxID=1946393 RepID=UPI0025C3F1CA|nr:molybdopterin molybdotransferase MoeA [Corynebacterium sp. UBA2622]